MANLAKLYAAKQNTGMDIMVTRAVKEAVQRVVSDINVNVEVLSQAVMRDVAERDRENATKVMAVVKGITPQIGQMVEQSVKAVLAEIKKIEGQDEIKRMVKGIRIPDHSGALAGLESAIRGMKLPETDLKPVLTQLKAIMDRLDEEDEEEEPKEWVFDVKRDEITKLIESVEVVAK